jgi:hypothetical protein
MYCELKIAVHCMHQINSYNKSILAPHTILSSVADLQKTPFYEITTDASNHKAENIFSLLIQHFSKTEGIVSKLIHVDSLKDETSETVSKYCIDTLKILHVPLSKCVTFCGNNTNTNFGGVNRNGTNNIFHKLKVEIGKDIEGIWCPAHILHNTVSTAADRLSTDVEAIVV